MPRRRNPPVPFARRCGVIWVRNKPARDGGWPYHTCHRLLGHRGRCVCACGVTHSGKRLVGS